MSENQSEKKQEISKEPVSDIEIENEKQAEQVKQVVVEAIRSELGKEIEIVRISTKYIEQNAELLVEAIKSIRAERQKIRRQNYGILPEWYKR